MNTDSYLGRLDSYEREVVGPYLHLLPAYAQRQVVDAIEEYRGQVLDTMLLADAVTKAAAQAVDEAGAARRGADWAEGYVSRAVVDAAQQAAGGPPR